MRQRAIAAERAVDTRVASQTIPFVLVCAGILILPTPLRGLLFGEVTRAVNFVTWFSIVLVLLSSRPPINVLRWRVAPVLVALLLAALLALALPASARSYLTLDVVAYVLPVLIVLFAGEPSLASSARRLLPIWSGLLNAAVAVIAAGGVADLLLNHAVSRFFAEFYGSASYAGLVSEERLVSFYGHALTSASIIMAAFCANYLLSIAKHRTRIPTYLLVLYVLAMALTTSKSGFVILLFAIVVTSFRSGRLRNLLILALALGAAYLYGFLDAVLLRLTESYAAGDLTTGRNDGLETLFGSGDMTFHLVTGQVIDNSNTALIAALEYPLLRFAFRYGIVFAAVFTLAYFVRPLSTLLKRGHRKPLLVWLALAIAVNTYSGISAYGDILLIFSITTMLALVVARDSYEATEKGSAATPIARVAQIEKDAHADGQGAAR